MYDERRIELDQIFLMPTIFDAQIAGGLLFGVKFAMGAWCPCPAAVGLAAGKIDARIYLFGVMAGSILFNQLFSLVTSLHTTSNYGVAVIGEHHFYMRTA